MEKDMLTATLLKTIASDIQSNSEYPAADSRADAGQTVFGLVEMLLKGPERLNALLRERRQAAEMISRFLAVSLASLCIFGAALGILLRLAPTDALPWFLRIHWAKEPYPSAIVLAVAYAAGFVLAAGVCLPSFYFYALLAGVRMTMLQVTAHIMRGMAATSLMLMGILPIYIAIVLGAVVFRLDIETIQRAVWLGLFLPFVAGVWGLYSIYQGFLSLADTIDPSRFCNRMCFLRRLTLSCTACYAAVAPVMIYTLWSHLIVACAA
jgi:hypothetical protein